MSLMPLAAWGWTLVIPTPLTVTQTALAISLLVASGTDFQHRKIYNWITYPAVLWAVFAAGSTTFVVRWLGIENADDFTRLAAVSLDRAVAGMLVCGSITLVAYLFSRGGAGDVKLSLAIGATLGVWDGAWAIALAYLFAAGTTVLVSFFQGRGRQLLSGLFRLFGSRWTPLISPPSATQREQLRKPIPLAGFFAWAYLVALI